jgi:competence protein CoiA
MSRYALDDNDRIVAAHDADLFCRYRCLECQSPLQKRSGQHRQAHFYHLQTMRQCRLHSQSVDHLIMQTEIQKMIPAITIERPFNKILRIADLCWEEKKIIFEIQCSPIDTQQADKRASDYSREGYELIWLLDDRLYNRKRGLRPAETRMREQTCYYFSMQRNKIYDQFEVIHAKQRLAKGPPLPVDLADPILASPRADHLTNQLDHRVGRYFFRGDLIDRVLRYPIYLQHLQELEKLTLAEQRPPNRLIFFLKKCFYIVLERLLRNYCR